MFKLHNYPASLYAWMTSNLRSRLRESGSYVYQDGDQIHNIYFLTKGFVGFALPRKGCFYAVIEPGDTFGVVDITHNIDKQIKKELKQFSCLNVNQGIDVEEFDKILQDEIWNIEFEAPLYRTFTVQVIEQPAAEL